MTTYRLGVEEIEPNHWVAHVFELPGCFSSAEKQDEAIQRASKEITNWLQWLHDNAYPWQLPRNNIEVSVAEIFTSWQSEENYWVNAFFKHDQRSMTSQEIDQVFWLLRCSRERLSQIIHRIPGSQFEKPNKSVVRGSIAEILEHIATAEWWYLDRLGMAFAHSEMPEDTLAKLQKVRAHTLRMLPQLQGFDQNFNKRGEVWSARKVLRRTLWHEGDHTAQIVKLVNY